MRSELEEVEARLAMEIWRDSQAEIDPDSDLTDMIPAMSRFLGWLNQGEDCEQKGMRVVAMLVVVRPDFIETKSLRLMSWASKRIFDDLVNDFRLNFVVRGSAHQVNVNGNGNGHNL